MGLAGINAPHIPYKGSPAVFTDVIGGRVTFVADPIAGMLPLIKGGKLRALGIASAQRSPMLPDAQTFDEQGFKGFTAAVWFGLLAPAGTPPASTWPSWVLTPVARMSGTAPAYRSTRIRACRPSTIRSLNPVMSGPAAGNRTPSGGADIGRAGQAVGRDFS